MRLVHRTVREEIPGPLPETPVFTHRGDMGDVLYSLPAMRAFLGTGSVRNAGILRLLPARFTSRRMSPAMVEAMRPLLELQPYVERAEFGGANGNLALDIWRGRVWPRHKLNLADVHLHFLGLPYEHSHSPWLRVDEVNPIAAVVIHRTTRYHNPRFPWRAVVKKYGRDAVMVGFPEEHEVFCEAFGHVSYYSTADLLELARVIAGSRLFIGNQSTPAAIAEGLKHRKVLEVSHPDNCEFLRPGAMHVRTGNEELPQVL